MANNVICPFYADPNFPAYLVEYRGDFIREMQNINYACYYIINSTLASVAVRSIDIPRLKKEVPSILFVDLRSTNVLQGISATDTSGIAPIKLNPYLNLDGTGVIVGIVDTGIDYLNEEFQTEDGKTRILTLWDQTLGNDLTVTHTLGIVYNSEDINKALALKAQGGDPYSIVPSIDTNGHGTHLAGIIAGRGKTKDFQGIANNAEIAVVKVIPSANYKFNMEKNGIFNVPAYNSSEIVAAVEFLKNLSLKLNKDIVISIGMGSTENSHYGSGLTPRYLDRICSLPRVNVVCGTGNEGASEGHFHGVIPNSGDISICELIVPKIIYNFRLKFWINSANKLSINIISPSGEQSQFITSKSKKINEATFIKEDVDVTISFYIPDDITGLNLIELQFSNVKPGIWKFELRGDYITDGIYDVWLPAKITLPEGTKFISATPYSTTTVFSTSSKAISVGYYNSENNSVVAASGKGYTTLNAIKPNLVAPGINILTTKVGGGTTTVSGCSVATAISVGICTLLVQWGNVLGNDTPLNTAKLISYLISGARRLPNYIYPNRDWGYGFIDLEGTFNFISGSSRLLTRSPYIEYKIRDLYVRIPKDLEVKNYDNA